MQETQWQQDREYTGPHYHIVHLAGADKSSGVMIIVAKWCCQDRDIRHCATLSGRVLHVRLHTAGAAIDAVCIYQHPWARHNYDCLSVQQKRSTVWDAMSRTVAALPRRNLSTNTPRGPGPSACAFLAARCGALGGHLGISAVVYLE